MAGSTVDDLKNPFEVTKATDFDDRQIASTWVDFPGRGGFHSLIDPRSPVARFVLGGKGSGRTHLMRYYSSGLQAIRLGARSSKLVGDEGYVGVYLNSSTLNAGRFAGKAQSDDTWSTVFSYYFDLWLGSRILMAIDELWTAAGNQDSIAQRIDIADFLDSPSRVPDAGTGFLHLRALLRELDSAINEAAITRELSVSIRSAPGRIPFGIIDAVGNMVGAFRNLQFALLVDEFENFSEAQQRYINTLIREKRPRAGFLVGARTGGVKTFATVGGEVNQEGSEFETIMLDSLHLQNSADYRRFCRLLVARRLVEAGLFASGEEDKVARTIEDHFSQPRRSRLGLQETAFISDQNSRERKSVSRLRKQLGDHRPASISDEEIDRIIRLLQSPSSPLAEKLSVYLFYRAWHRRERLPKAAEHIHQQAEGFIGGKGKSSFTLAMGHFRNDMLAQLLSDYRQKQRYLGFAQFVELSGGLPRGLLVVLKHVFRWSLFNGESPFSAGHTITTESQRTGVREASNWFLQDQPGIGASGARAQAAVEKLGNFLKALRFSDKPAESSLCTVGIDRATLSDKANSVVDNCVEFSFLLRITSGHKDRNTRLRKQKLQVHPMLCPLWDLPTGRRGVVELSGDEGTAIFDESHADRLASLTKNRLRRMNAPFGGANDSDALPNLYD